MTLLDATRERLVRLDPARLDVAIAAGFVFVWVIEALLVDPGGVSRAPTLLLGCAALSTLAWRRRLPALPALALVAAMLADAALDGYLLLDTNVPYVSSLFIAYSLGRHSEGSQMVIVFAVFTAGVLAGLELGGVFLAGDVIWVCVMYTAPLLVGRALRNRERLQHQLRDKASELEAGREERARRAVERERAAIAGELQAVVANGVSAMVVQAEAVPRLVAAQRLERAAEALAVIEETGRDALTEMRRLLGALRRDDDSAELAPQPSLRRVAALVEAMRSRGLQARLERNDDAGRSPGPGVDLAAYRGIERALSSAAECGARTAAVRVKAAGRDLELEVEDDRPHAAAMDAAELAALRERVSIYGGHLKVEQADRHRLVARLPLEDS